MIDGSCHHARITRRRASADINTQRRDPRDWTTPRGRPHASRLRQVESYLKDTGMASLASAWAMARRRLKEYRRKVDAATRCSGVYPHTRPTCQYCISGSGLSIGRRSDDTHSGAGMMGTNWFQVGPVLFHGLQLVSSYKAVLLNCPGPGNGTYLVRLLIPLFY